MAFRPERWFERRTREGASRQWAVLAEDLEEMRPTTLRSLQGEAQELRTRLDRFLMRSDRRAARSRAALDLVRLPGGTDWRWRPDLLAGPISPRGIASPNSGTRLSDAAAVWHDCSERALMLQQLPNPRATDLSPYVLLLEVFGFTGSFLSLAIDLPIDALDGLTASHVIRMETTVMIERPMRVFARLNIGHGPNTEEITLELDQMRPGFPSEQVLEFDLADTEMNEKRLEKIWLDLIFEGPAMNAAQIRELFLSRHLRAEF